MEPHLQVQHQGFCVKFKSGQPLCFSLSISPFIAMEGKNCNLAVGCLAILAYQLGNILLAQLMRRLHLRLPFSTITYIHDSLVQPGYQAVRLVTPLKIDNMIMGAQKRNAEHNTDIFDVTFMNRFQKNAAHKLPEHCKQSVALFQQSTHQNSTQGLFPPS
eukprot:1156899-Pelagomonas_calceolata.AAC.5